MVRLLLVFGQVWMTLRWAWAGTTAAMSNSVTAIIFSAFFKSIRF